MRKWTLFAAVTILTATRLHRYTSRFFCGANYHECVWSVRFDMQFDVHVYHSVSQLEFRICLDVNAGVYLRVCESYFISASCCTLPLPRVVARSF